MNGRRKWLAALALLLLSTGAMADRLGWIEVQGQRLKVELAESGEEKAQGLMHRQRPPPEGMLFINPAPQSVSVWMKDVRFPLDILFFDQDDLLGAFHDAAPPCTTPRCVLYESPSPASWVLELPAGERQRRGIVVGARLLWLGYEGDVKAETDPGVGPDQPATHAR